MGSGYSVFAGEGHVAGVLDTRSRHLGAIVILRDSAGSGVSASRAKQPDPSEYLRMTTALEVTMRAINALCQDCRYGLSPFDAGELLVEALELVGEAFVVDAHAVEDGGVQVVDVDGVFDGVVGEVVGFAVDVAGLDAAAGEPGAEVSGVMVAAVVFVGEFSLGIDGAAELTAPDDERFVEQAVL